MSNNGIKLSPKYGLNPTIPVCFWCGQPKNEIALLGKLGDRRKGEDIEAPRECVLDYEPCATCKENMDNGFTLMEVSEQPTSKGQPPMQTSPTNLYPTGRFVVLKMEAAERIFKKEYITSSRKLLMPSEVFNQFVPDED